MGEYHLRALDNKKIWKALKMKPSSSSKEIFVKYKNRLVALETIDKFNFEFLLIINEADSNGVAYILRKSLTGGSKNKNSQRMIITNAKSGYDRTSIKIDLAKLYNLPYEEPTHPIVKDEKSNEAIAQEKTAPLTVSQENTTQELLDSEDQEPKEMELRLYLTLGKNDAKSVLKTAKNITKKNNLDFETGEFNGKAKLVYQSYDNRRLALTALKHMNISFLVFVYDSKIGRIVYTVRNTKTDEKSALVVTTMNDNADSDEIKENLNTEGHEVIVERSADTKEFKKPIEETVTASTEVEQPTEVEVKPETKKGKWLLTTLFFLVAICLSAFLITCIFETEISRIDIILSASISVLVLAGIWLLIVIGLKKQSNKMISEQNSLDEKSISNKGDK